MSTWRGSIMGQSAARADTCHSTGPSPVLPGMVHQGSGLTAAPVAPSTLLPHHWSSPSPAHISGPLGIRKRRQKGEFMLSWGQGCASKWLRE